MEKKLSGISNVRLISEIGIMAAIGFVLDELASALSKGLFPNGGAIGIAMVAVLIISYRRGLIAGLITGLIMGILDLATGPFMVAASPFKVILQVSLDYVFPYFLMGLAGIFKRPFDKADNKGKILFILFGVLVAGLGKLLSHYLAGVMFWADPSAFAWDMTNINPYLYCLIYNGAFTVPCMILSFLVMLIIYKRAPQLINQPLEENEAMNNKSKVGYILPGIIFLVGLAQFSYFFIKYLQSFYYGNYGSDGSEISFDSDMLVLWISGLLIALFSIISIVLYHKNISHDRYNSTCILFIIMANIIYALSRIIKCARKGYDFNDYKMWIVVCLILLVFYCSYHLVIKKEFNKKS